MPGNIKKRNGLLLIGPMSPPFGGEALAFKVVVDYIMEENSRTAFFIDKAKFNNSRYYFLLNPIYFIVNLLRYSFHCDSIYVTSGSNRLGKIRDIIIAFIATIFNHKVIFHIHGSAYIDLKKKSLLNYLIHRALSSFYKIIILSEQFKKHFDYVDPTKILVVPNSIYPNTPFFSCNSKDELSKEKNEVFTLLYMSHVLPSKGFFDILEALENLESDGIRYVFHFAGSIIGEGKDTVESIHKIISEYKNRFKDRFVIHGFVNNNKKWDLLKSSHIFLLPTQFHAEGFPISILEAMYFGNAIITTKWRAITDIIEENKNGLYVNYNSPNEIYDKIKYLYNNKNVLSTIGMNNHKEIQKNYMPSNFRKNIISFINS